MGTKEGTHSLWQTTYCHWSSGPGVYEPSFPLRPPLTLLFQGVVQSDPDLMPHVEHLKYRWRRFIETKTAIEAAEGSLTEFSLVGAFYCCPDISD